jgi:hypothetical protein
MTRRQLFVATVLLAGIVCSTASSSSAQDAANPAKLDIALSTVPAPAKAGENKFEVTVKDASGKPLADVDVTLQLVMPAMPGMAEMKSDVKLKAEEGKFTGTGQMGMMGNWNTTVTVKKDGKLLAEKKSTLTAR